MLLACFRCLRLFCVLSAIVLCLAVAGCDVAGYVMVELPMEVTWILDSRLSSGPSSRSMGRALGDGSSLLITLDLSAIPQGTKSEQIGAASVRIAASSFSQESGSASFAAFSLTPIPDKKPPMDKPDMLWAWGEIASGAKPLSVCSISHEPGWDERQVGYVTYRTFNTDSSVKHMNFDIAKAIKAWLDGTISDGTSAMMLKIVQTSIVDPNGPRWQLAGMGSSKGENSPRAAVWIKKADNPVSPGE